ncbi:MAG TPA: DUF2470 domain-containing protein [Ancylobacter sp.]
MTSEPSTAGFDATSTVKRLLREARTGALATLDTDGAPYASLVQVATLPDGAPILLLSQLARHTRNLQADERVSLLLDERRQGDELQGARASVKGRITRITDDAVARRRFLARHPDAAGFAGFTDFAFYEVTPLSAHLVAGFGRIIELPASDFLTDISGADALLEGEPGAVAHMNADHADAIGLYAAFLLGAPKGAWRLTGFDPDGCDLMAGDLARRLPFPRRVTSSGELRAVLVELANQARGAAA